MVHRTGENRPERRIDRAAFLHGTTSLKGEVVATALPAWAAEAFGPYSHTMDIYPTEHYAKNSEPRIRTDVVLSDAMLGAIERRLRRERAEPADADVLLPLFAECHERGLWLVADRVHYVVKMRGRTYFLSRFSRTQNRLESVEATNERHRTRRGALHLHRALGTKVSTADKGTGTRVSSNYTKRGGPSERLGEILLRALTASGCGVIPPKNPEDLQCAALQHELRKNKLCSAETSEELIRVVRVRADRSVVFDVIRASVDGWGSGGRPYGLIVFEVSRIEGTRLVVRLRDGSAKWKVTNRLFRFGETSTSGPFLAIATCTLGRNGEEELGYAYVHPVWKKDSFVCVDSDGERRVTDFLARYAASCLGKNLECTKVYGEYRVAGTWPDFEVRRGFRTLAIEVLGFDSADYLAKKQQQRDIMLNAGISVAHVRTYGRTRHTAISGLADSLQGICEA